MEIRTFWKIVLRIFGLWLLVESIYIFPQFITTLSYISANDDYASLFLAWGSLIVLLVIYILIVKLAIVKSDWIINKLKLDQNFNESKMELNFDSVKILNIAVIIIGALILIESIPMFLKQTFQFFQQETLFREYQDSSWIIFYFMKMLIGYLAVTNSKAIAEFIDKKGK